MSTGKGIMKTGKGVVRAEPGYNTMDHMGQKVCSNV